MRFLFDDSYSARTEISCNLPQSKLMSVQKAKKTPKANIKANSYGKAKLTPNFLHQKFQSQRVFIKPNLSYLAL
jgi:hypothetical protein